MKSTFLSILVLSLIFVSCTARKQVYYVSENGDDANPGTVEAPFASPAKALGVLKENNPEGIKEGAQVIVEEGTYPIEKTLFIDSKLSRVEIRVKDGAEVIFSGGKDIPLDLLEEEKTSKGLAIRYKVDLRKAGIADYGKLRNVGFGRPFGPAWAELFVNDKPMHLSRWPNHEMIPMGKVLNTGSVPRFDDFENRGGVIQYDSARIDSWAGETDAWMAGYFKWGYADDMVRIAEIDTKDKTLKTASATLYGYGSGSPWQQWYGVNILAELDAPGEYYIDRDKGILYFISDEQAIESIRLSSLQDPFIQLEGTNSVRISGITFECSRGLGIAMDNTKDVRIENCSFRNLGSLGVTIGKGIEPFKDYLHEGSGEPASGIVGSLQQHLYANSTFFREGGESNCIVDCEFYNLGAGGVVLGGGNRKTLEPGNNRVENCIFHDVNRIEKAYRPAVYITGVGNRVRHCEIYNTPSMAIYMMFGNDNIIEYNYFHDVCMEAEDQGAVYYGRNPSERGNIVRYNFFDHIPDHFNTCAIYHDDGACGMTVYGNVFYHAGKWDVLIGGGSDITYQNNIFIGSRFGIHVDNRLENWSKGLLDEGGLYERRLKAVDYKNPPYSEKYPELVNYFDENPALPKRNVIENNVFVETGNVVDGKMEWLEYRENLETDRNIGFTDWENKDFSLKSDSEVYTKQPGFKELPFEKIGLIRELKKK